MFCVENNRCYFTNGETDFFFNFNLELSKFSVVKFQKSRKTLI